MSVKLLRTVQKNTNPGLSQPLSDFIRRSQCKCLYSSMLTKTLKRFHKNKDQLLEQCYKVYKGTIRLCQLIAIQRFRRGHQDCLLYSRIWEKEALNQFLSVLRCQVRKKAGTLLSAALLLPKYNWEEERLNDEHMIT